MGVQVGRRDVAVVEYIPEFSESDALDSSGVITSKTVTAETGR